MSEKKRRELSYFAFFREIYDEVPQGIACVQENPDFVIRASSCRIGIEVTRYFRPTPTDRRPLQEQFSLQHQIAQRAQREFERLSDEKLSVQIVFQTGVNVTKSDLLPCANVLASNLVGVGTTELRTRVELANARWPKSILSVYARKCFESEPSLWRPATAAWVRRLTPADIQHEIFRKESSLSGYDSELSKVWLLIVADGMAFVELSDEAAVHVYRSQFNRVIFLDVFRRKWTDFKIERIEPVAPSSADVA